MASVYSEIRAVFETRLAAIPGIPTIAWENVSFDPNTNQSYVKPRMVPTVREPAVRGLNPQIYYQGYYLFDVYTPEGSGPSVADDLADLIIEQFEATTDITDGNIIVPLRYAERDLGVKEGAFYKTTVRVGWYYYN
jgi:hypothetical protein